VIYNNKEWLNIDEVAMYTGYKKKTIYNLTHDNKIPHNKPRGKLLFKRIEVDKWLESVGIRIPNNKNQ
jgi:excisionase family DNA binding protein